MMVGEGGPARVWERVRAKSIWRAWWCGAHAREDRTASECSVACLADSLVFPPTPAASPTPVPVATNHTLWARLTKLASPICVIVM
jgi:hypothetical protein